ncbi:hypothetical protein SeLEV6574_g06306 [Synchytrium endobioticum]|uniref:Uncharacterized protein n=1 Tax=Synchytrium endobioticum TaxID=286115 RepID=A0A507CPC0_9FUNG|nr:hypothetical protein SeLEV6574_g06306 [Synchytrium endobioticum]
MKVLAIVTISLCWTSIARAAPPKDRFSALLEPQYIEKVGKLPPPYDYMKSDGMSVDDLWKFLETGIINMERKRSALSEAQKDLTISNKWKGTPQSRRAREIANELDRMTFTDTTLGLPFDDLRKSADFHAFVPAKARLKILQMMKEFGKSRLNSRLSVAKYQIELLSREISVLRDCSTKTRDLNRLVKLHTQIPGLEKELAAREVRYNGLIEPLQGARDTDVNDKGKAPMGHGGQTSADQVGPQNYPFPCPEQTSTGYNQEDLYTIVAQRPQSINNIYAGDSWGDVWALNQGGVNDGPYLASEAYMNQHEASTLGYQEFHGGASGLGHGAKRSSVYEGSTLMHDSYLYHGGQTSVDQIEPQNPPVLPFPEQTPGGYNQEDLYTIVAQRPQSNDGSIYASDSGDNAWASNQGGSDGGQQSEAYINQPETSTLGYQEFPGDASGLGHGAKRSSVYEGSTLMHNSYLYHGGQTSVDQVGPQNHPVLPFPEQTPGGHNQEDLYTIVAQRPKSNYDSWRHGESHTSASQVDNPMHPRDHGSEIGQNSVHDNTAHRDDQYTLSKYDKGPSYRHIQK